MKKINLLLFTLIVGTSMIFNTSCESKQGCTDSISDEYDATAEEDDGSCTYDGAVIFWYEEAIADQLIDEGAIELSYYIDDILVGKANASDFLTAAPKCSDDGTVSFIVDLEHQKTQHFTYSIKDQTDFEYWAGDIDILAETCIVEKLSNKKK